MLDNGVIFDARIAEKFSVEEAIVINKLFGWLKYNAVNGKNFKEGRYWTFNSISAFKKYFPFWNESKIKRVLIDLAGCTEKSDSKPKHEPIIIKGNFNRNSFDRTIWYSFTDDFFAYLEKLGYDLSADIPQAENGYSADGQMEIPQKEDQYQLNRENNNNKINTPLTPKGEEQTSLFGMDADEEKEKEKKTSKKFVKPTVEEIDAYCRERNNTIDAESFFNFYESKGWLVGKSPMKDWKAAVRTWEKNRQQTSTTPQIQSNKYEMIDEQGNRYYLQGYGKHKVIIPKDAPPRPSETMFWSNFTKSWYQP